MFLRLLSSSALILFIMAITAFDARKTIQDPCSTVNATVKISKGNNSENIARVELSGAKAPVRYFFSDSKGHLLTTDYSSSEIKNLKAGKYTCLVRDAAECRKLIEFEVK